MRTHVSASVYQEVGTVEHRRMRKSKELDEMENKDEKVQGVGRKRHTVSIYPASSA